MRRRMTPCVDSGRSQQLDQEGEMCAWSMSRYGGLQAGYFIWHGQVNWTLGLVLAVGNMIGSVIGVKLTILKGHRLVKAVVTVSVIALAIALIVGVGT